jgi:hypothetical protein
VCLCTTVLLWVVEDISDRLKGRSGICNPTWPFRLLLCAFILLTRIDHH